MFWAHGKQTLFVEEHYVHLGAGRILWQLLGLASPPSC